MTVLVDHDARAAETLASALGPGTTILTSVDGLGRHLDEHPDEAVVVLAASVDGRAAFEFAERMRVSRPALGVILIRRRLDASILADALRAGVREVISDRDLPGLSAAVRRSGDIARRMREREGVVLAGTGRSRGRVITVFNAKGGCGKTTLATNLAVALADAGRREVCLVDLDLSFGDVAIAMQLFPAHTIVDAVPLAGSLDESGVRGLLTPHSPGLSALAAPVAPGTAENVPATLVVELLETLRGIFDYVVIDTPPTFSDHVLSAFDASDMLLLIATLDIPALKNLKLTLETLDLLNHPRERWRLVLNRADSKVGLDMEEVERTLRVPLSLRIPSSRDVPESINQGRPLILQAPNHPVSQAIRQFIKAEILVDGPGSLASDIPPVAVRRGLLRRKAKMP
jgi:pilus assembly protein CpaE